jgi:iron complex outermembrane receptor protein
MEGIFQYAPDPNNLMKFGLQFRFTDNTNNPETGILPLIPDFQMLNPAGFFIIQNNKRKINYELGARYDLRHVDAVTITSTSPRTIKRFENSYNNVGLHFGSAFPIIKSLKSKLNLSFNQRAPGINELYSFGLHQGVSGIEEGNLELNDERSLKLLWTLNLFHREKLFLESTAYYQKIDGYIFLEPQNEYRLTIRGAFPLFVYKQTNAAIYGMDLLLKYEPDKYWIALFKYALTRGRDISQNSDLVYIPADNIHASLQYRFNEKLKLRDAYLAFDTEVNFEQSRYNPNLDFLPPPEGYVLLGLKGGFKIYLEASILHFNLTMENMMNKRYRNYLNRQRYFADETGRAIKFNVLFDF